MFLSSFIKFQKRVVLVPIAPTAGALDELQGAALLDYSSVSVVHL